MVLLEQLEGDCCYLKQNFCFKLSKCPRFSLRGIKFPLYCFGGRPAKGEDDAYKGTSCTVEGEQSLMDCLLLAQWEECACKGLLKYDGTNCEYCCYVHQWKFEVYSSVEQGMESKLFYRTCREQNSPASGLFQIQLHENPREGATFLCCMTNCELITSSVVPNDANLIVLNVNPVEYGIVFIILRKFYHLPQFLDSRSLKVAAQVAVDINNRSFRVFFDYHAFSRVNLYFQACYYANPLPVEHVPVVPVIGNWQKSVIQIFEVSGYPVKALAFKGIENFEVLVTVVSEICSSLQHQNIAFSLLISECGMKMFLFPKVHTPAAIVCNLSAWECSGHFIYRSRCDFDLVDEQTVVKRLASISLDSKAFQAVKQLSCSIASKFAEEAVQDI